MENRQYEIAKDYFIKASKSSSANSYQMQIECLIIASLSIKDKKYYEGQKYLDKNNIEKYDKEFFKDLGYLYYELFLKTRRIINLIKARYFFEGITDQNPNNCTIFENLLYIYHFFQDDISFNDIAEKSKNCFLDLRYHRNSDEELIKIKELLKNGIITEVEYNQQNLKLKNKND